MTNIPAELMKKAERIRKFEGDPKMLLADSVVLVAIALHARDKRAAEIALAEAHEDCDVAEQIAAAIETYKE